ncbi:GNAT family N-acetyltransferase [Filifactor villosus]|uniref:GNAT family N-acetyltransferase n=1 Tax=Filifactor villosus TaxID=29374 RepID=A0ABV9QM88_9FIRM
MELRRITEDNYEACLELKATVENQDFVDPVVYSLAEAFVFYDDSEVFAIYQEEELVGFVSMYTGEGRPQIINFLIDDSFQNRGYGTTAAKLCIDYLRENYNANIISAPVQVEHNAAQNFWKKLGFSLSDTVENGYIFMRLKLS